MFGTVYIWHINETWLVWLIFCGRGWHTRHCWLVLWGHLDWVPPKRCDHGWLKIVKKHRMKVTLVNVDMSPRIKSILVIWLSWVFLFAVTPWHLCPFYLSSLLLCQYFTQRQNRVAVSLSIFLFLTMPLSFLRWWINEKTDICVWRSKSCLYLDPWFLNRFWWMILISRVLIRRTFKMSNDLVFCLFFI